MNPKDTKDLDDILIVIGRLSPVARERLEKKVAELSDGRESSERAQVVAWAREGADSVSANYTPDQKLLARAWILRSYVLTFGGFPSFGERATTTSSLAQIPAAQLEQKLQSACSSGQLVKDLSVAQRSPNRNQWGKGAFTNPRNHHPKAFRYLIHCMRPTAGLGDVTGREEYLRHRTGGYIDEDPKGWTLNSARLYLEKPEFMLSELLSCSVIDHNHCRTYSDFSFGYILDVAQANVCCASTSDMAINNATGRGDSLAKAPSWALRTVQVDDFLDTMLGMYQTPLTSPMELMEASRQANGHNEVLVLGTTPYGHVRPCGIFIKTMPDGTVWQSFLDADKTHGLRRLMIARDLPLCEIPDSRGTASKTTFEDWVKKGQE